MAAGSMGSQVRTAGSFQGDMESLVGKIESSGRGRLDSYGDPSRMMNNGGSSNQVLVKDFHTRRTANAGIGGGASMQLAYPQFRDPFQYWQERTQWFNPAEMDEDLAKMREWARLLYATHYLVPSLIDIYTRFPLLDIEFHHKDAQLVEFHERLFFDQLNYLEHLYDMGREHWISGEVFSLGSWHDGIGAWEDDEIINPDDIVVSRSRLMRTHNFRVKVPTEIKQLIETQQPKAEYEMLKQMYPDLVQWAKKDQEIPVSDILMKQIKFKTTPWSRHGTPILLRAFRQLMLEESLNAAQDAVADRFYSPLILAKLGLDNVDDQGPWIPDPMELDQLRNDLNVALASDMRLMVYHHGLDITNVFGREQMPRLDQDFDRIEAKLMMVFGIGPELLKGGQSNAPYASGALNRELITQMLETYQINVRRFMYERMEPVAERQGHYEYEKKGDRRVPIMETVLVVDEETGEEYVQERPKLAIPEVRFKAMNLRDEKVERDFLRTLKDQGFPISDGTLAMNIPLEFEDELEKSHEEKMKKTLAEQQFKADLFERLKAQNLPIPPDFQEEYTSWNAARETGNSVTDMAVGGMGGEGEEGGGGEEGPAPDVPGLAEVPGFEDAVAARPVESDEMRENMPQPTSSRDEERVASIETGVEGFEKVSYSERMRFGTPREFRERVKMVLPTGMKIAAADNTDRFDEEEWERDYEEYAASLPPEEEEELTEDEDE